MSTEANLPVRQISEALNDLPGFQVTMLKRAHRDWRGADDTPWMARVDVDVADGRTLKGVCGRGSTPDDAITALWEQVTDLPRGQWLALRTPHRRDMVWSGFMWHEVDRDMEAVNV